LPQARFVELLGQSLQSPGRGWGHPDGRYCGLPPVPSPPDDSARP
jgi:hypothetical protein